MSLWRSSSLTLFRAALSSYIMTHYVMFTTSLCFIKPFVTLFPVYFCHPLPPLFASLSVCPSIHISDYLSINLSPLSIPPSICLLIYLFICLFIHSVCLSVDLSIYITVQAIYLSIYPSKLSIYLSNCLGPRKR